VEPEVNIGLLGGTFDPIHIGHLIAAEEVRVKVGLGEVLFVPAGQPWLKSDRAISAAEHRLEMVRLAIDTNPEFKLSRVEVERPGPSYTVDTVRELRRQFEAGAELFFILGLDLLDELPRWKEPARLIEMCRLVAVTRPGYDALRLQPLEKSIPGISTRLDIVEMPPVGISASDIRRRIAHGLSIKYLVPESVESYIYEHGLYRIKGGE
jgi:nicotinate-nucleotide adenylyltransferase